MFANWCSYRATMMGGGRDVNVYISTGTMPGGRAGGQAGEWGVEASTNLTPAPRSYGPGGLQVRRHLSVAERLGGMQGCSTGVRRPVHVRALLHQVLHNSQVAL